MTELKKKRAIRTGRSIETSSASPPSDPRPLMEPKMKDAQERRERGNNSAETCQRGRGADVGELEDWECIGNDRSKSAMHAVSAQQLKAIERMLLDTFKPIMTRDRKDGTMPKFLRVLRVERVENSAMWRRYTDERSQVQIKRSHKCTPLAAVAGGDVLTSLCAASLGSELDHYVNEVSGVFAFFSTW